MNRRQKIIVSVTGIFIVLLILIGITYGYFLTRITGNSNPTSISVTTANLELLYGDGTTAILTSETPLMPSSTPIGTKDFTVTNNGDDSEYVVVFEDVTVKYAADTVIDGQAVSKDTPTTFESNDFVYTLTCTVKDKSGNTLSDKSCDGVENDTFPMDGGIVVGNSIDKDDVHTYLLTLYYLDNGLEQSADMNKALNGKVNIKDIKSINPYSENTSSLAYNIINNSMLNKNGTELLSKPLSSVAESISRYGSGKFNYETVKTSDLCYGYAAWLVGDTEIAAQSGSTVSSYEAAVEKYVYDDCSRWTKFLESYDSSTSTLTFKSEEIVDEKTLSVTQDDLGTSYYYRGNVEDNYVNFAGMCWRVVRILGDGSVKIILEDKNTTCNNTSFTGEWGISEGNYGYVLKSGDIESEFGYGEKTINYLNPVTNADKSMVKAFYDFQTTGKLKDYTNKLKSGNWCLADKAYTQSGSYPNYTYTLLDHYDYSSKMYYDSYVRLFGDNKEGYKPTLKCTGTVLDKFESVTYKGTEIIEEVPMYVSALTADEMVYAGIKSEDYTSNFMLLNLYLLNESLDYVFFWSLSPSEDAMGLGMDVDGRLQSLDVNIDRTFRPAVTLQSNTIITDGEGTIDDPYTIKVE